MYVTEAWSEKHTKARVVNAKAYDGNSEKETALTVPVCANPLMKMRGYRCAMCDGINFSTYIWSTMYSLVVFAYESDEDPRTLASQG